MCINDVTVPAKNPCRFSKGTAISSAYSLCEHFWVHFEGIAMRISDTMPDIRRLMIVDLALVQVPNFHVRGSLAKKTLTFGQGCWVKLQFL